MRREDPTLRFLRSPWSHERRRSLSCSAVAPVSFGAAGKSSGVVRRTWGPFSLYPGRVLPLTLSPFLVPAPFLLAPLAPLAPLASLPRARFFLPCFPPFFLPLLPCFASSSFTSPSSSPSFFSVVPLFVSFSSSSSSPSTPILPSTSAPKSSSFSTSLTSLTSITSIPSIPPSSAVPSSSPPSFFGGATGVNI